MNPRSLAKAVAEKLGSKAALTSFASELMKHLDAQQVTILTNYVKHLTSSEEQIMDKEKVAKELVRIARDILAAEPKVEKTKPGSKNKYKITYPNGKVEYTNDDPKKSKPGAKSKSNGKSPSVSSYEKSRSGEDKLTEDLSKSLSKAFRTNSDSYENQIESLGIKTKSGDTVDAITTVSIASGKPEVNLYVYSTEKETDDGDTVVLHDKSFDLKPNMSMDDITKQLKDKLKGVLGKN